MATLREILAPRLRAARGAGLDVLFPRWCVACNGLVEESPLLHLCAACFAEITFAEAPHCNTCGWPFLGEVEGSRRCPHCLDLNPQYHEGRTGLILRGVARHFLHEFKYRRGLHLQADLRALARHSHGLLDFVHGATLVPVPLHEKRLRWRGFNQARLLAEALAAETSTAGLAELLLRLKETPTQTRFDRAERERNMRGAFALRPGADLDPARRYVLIDDVFTTGATLNACAEVLHHAGARHLDVATLGHG